MGQDNEEGNCGSSPQGELLSKEEMYLPEIRGHLEIFRGPLKNSPT
jgi:hypothetical protein